MKFYVKPEIEATEFKFEDIILTSSGGLVNNGDETLEGGDVADAGGDLVSISLFK